MEQLPSRMMKKPEPVSPWRRIRSLREEPLLEGVCDLLELWRRQVGEHCEARNAVCDLVLAGHRRAMSSAIPTARGLCATTFGRRRIIV